MVVAITGENGFLGKHLTKYFSDVLQYQAVSLGRDFLGGIGKLKEVDYLIHGASVHRSEDPQSVYRENMDMNQKLVDALCTNNIKINIIFISSVHEAYDTPYGRSKKDGKALFAKYCAEKGTIFISHTLPNLFGPFAKPNNTSFVATFCFNLHNNLESNYNTNVVNLCYVGDAVTEIGKCSAEHTHFKTVQVKVCDVLEMLRRFKKEIHSGQTPVTRSQFEQNMLQTLISYESYF
jgi:nucleoside-diphosphate-sugar epimerase